MTIIAQEVSEKSTIYLDGNTSPERHGILKPIDLPAVSSESTAQEETASEEDPVNIFSLPEIDTGNPEFNAFFEEYALLVTKYLQEEVAPEIKRILNERIDEAIAIERDKYTPIIEGKNARIKELELEVDAVQIATANEYQLIIDSKEARIRQLEREDFLANAARMGGSAVGGWVLGQFARVELP